jgi:hypothetical protein
MTTYSEEGKVGNIIWNAAQKHAVPLHNFRAEIAKHPDGTASLFVFAEAPEKETGRGGAFLAGLVAGVAQGKYERDIPPAKFDGENTNQPWLGIKFCTYNELAQTLNAMTNRQALKLVMEPEIKLSRH